MKIAICDPLGLCYDGNTLSKQGLGGSESAVILIAKELSKIGFSVTVYNNCEDGSTSSPGIYENVRYIDNKHAILDETKYDIVIVSRTINPFVTNQWPFVHIASKKILWLHDTFIEGDEIMEDLVTSGKIDYIFTLSDWHTSYILNSNHGKRRNYEVLKKHIFQTRNGAVCHIPEVNLSEKNPHQFVYNASATKGMIPLVENIWPEIKKKIPEANLIVIGGYYKFRENSEPDEQEKTVKELASSQHLKDLGITFTGIITQKEIAKILSESWMMLYPGAFPETFGISSLESLLYKTPLLTTKFGALEETAVDLACYQINYAIEPNSLFPHIDKEKQIELFLEEFFRAYSNPYLHQQKQNYCDVIKDIVSWDTIALQWKQFFYSIMGEFLPLEEYRKITRINDKVSRVFGRTSIMPILKEYKSYGTERRIIVVSPFWNAENYIEKHIRSVASQDYENYIHVLIDDNSSDSSVEIAEKTIEELKTDKTILLKNDQNEGCIANQLSVIRNYAKSNDLIMLLDGDDWLLNNNTIFHYYNDLYAQGYDFTYGSMWSIADDIPLIAQEYPEEIKAKRNYRDYHFNWKIPYTHLRTCLGKYFLDLDENKFKVNGKWMKAGADNPLFYELIERVDPNKIYCNREIVCFYNDINPLNDYKVKSEEQNNNANLSYRKSENKMKKILVAIPTDKYIEVETFKSLWDLEIPEGYELDFRYSYGYNISQIRNLIAEWAKEYDYLLSVDSDIILPKDALKKMLKSDKDIISGLYIQRIPDTHTLEVYMDLPNGGCANIPYELIYNLGVVEIAACGMGATLIKSEVFSALSYPHFYYKEALDHKNTVSEDVYFCKKARENGFTVWADPSIKCDHKGNTYFKVEDSKSHLEKVSKSNLLPREHSAYLKQMEVNPKVIYDIGACVQHWTREAKTVWPNAKYYLLDGSKSVEKYLKDESYAIIVLSDRDGKLVDFYEDPNNPGGNSYYKENTGAYTDLHKSRRVTMALDTIVEENEWLKPDLVKIDVQGAELDVLRGAKKTIEHCKDIILEAQHVNYNEGAPKVEEVKTYLESIGFELVSEIAKNDVDGDYHFTRKI